MTTPADLRKAIESNEGICGVRVTVVPVPKTTMYLKGIKWESISTLLNFEITTAGVRAFKTYGTVARNFRSWTSFAGKHASFNSNVCIACALCLFGLKLSSKTKH